MLEGYKGWLGTAEELVSIIAMLAATYVPGEEPPTLRVVRDWRSKGILSQPKQKPFGYRQVLEGIAAFWWFSKKGWQSRVIVETLSGLQDTDLAAFVKRMNIDGGPATTAARDTRRQVRDANVAIELLARGIVRQYHYTVLGRHGIIRQTQPQGEDGGIHKDLRLAISKLGRLQVECEGKDNFACVHDVLNRAKNPISAEGWRISLFDQPDFEYRDIFLIDPIHSTPTPECQDLAGVAAGGEADLIEGRLHDQLRNIVGRSVQMPSEVYTAIRGFMSRPGMNGFSRAFYDYYNELHEGLLIEGVAHQCAHCRALMRPHRGYPLGICSVEPCFKTNPPTVGACLDPRKDQLFIAVPAVMTFWITPAFDEIRIHDAAKTLGYAVELFPEEDACDVGINGREIGIDAKNYASPVWLARKLNISIGRLGNYETRVIAVSDHLVQARRDYIAVMRGELLRKGDPSTLRVMTVSQVIDWLREGCRG
jgi:hypothetical protein